jgi:HTH-type transcriptional regulator, quorum sensing regulator NprR
LLKLLNIKHNISKGGYLRYKRKKLGWTQEKVCEGICSVTYLSKIETGKVVPNEEIFLLLCERLNICPSDIDQFPTDELEELFDQIYEAIECRKIEKAKKLVDEIKPFESFIELEPELYLSYILLMYYFYLTIGNFHKAHFYMTNLMDNKEHLSTEQKLMFQYFRGVHLCIDQQYEKGLSFLLAVEKTLVKQGIKYGNLYFHLAMAYSFLQNSIMAVYYAQTALKLYDETTNYLRSLDCKMILGINYARTKNFHAAEKEYRQILDLATTLQMDDILARVYHNLGFMYFEKKWYQEAEKMFKESIQYREEHHKQRIWTTLYLIDLYIEQQRFEDANTYLQQLRHHHAIQEMEIEIEYRVKRMNYLQQPDKGTFEEAYIDFVTTNYLPYIEKINEHKKRTFLLTELGNYFYKKRKYKLAADYFRLVNEYQISY